MAFVLDSTNTSTRAYSIGPTKQVIVSGSVLSTDTSAVVTVAPLTYARIAQLCGVIQTAAPTYSGNTITFTFAAPGGTGAYIQATVHGT